MKYTLLFFLSLAINTIGFCQIPTAGLVVYWPLNGNYSDAGTYNIAGTNFASTASTNKQGTANTAMAFTNPTSVVAQYRTHAFNSNVNFTSAQDFTISFLMYINSPYVHPCGLYDNNLNYAGPGVFFWTSNGYPQIQFNFKNGSVGSTNGALSLATWHFINAVKESGNIKIYINGTLNNTAATGVATPVYSFPARFGSMFFNSFSPPQYNGLHGKLDEFRIYNRALTAVEISAMSISVLPVKLTNFTALLLDNETKLNWQTAQEQNSSHFEIERSVDGKNFDAIGRVNTIGNSSSLANYSYNDKLTATALSATTIYYRLKSIDLDGSFQYSKIIPIHLKKTNELLVFPNPAKDNLNVQTTSATNKKATVSIVDAIGKLVIQKDIQLLKGKNIFQIDISSLQNGQYHLKINETDVSYEKAFLKFE